MYVKHVCLYSLQALSLSNSLQIVLRTRCRAKEAARDLLAAVEAQHAYIPAFGSAGVTVEMASSSAASASPGVAGVPAFTKATEFKLFGGHARYADAVGLLRYAISPVSSCYPMSFCGAEVNLLTHHSVSLIYTGIRAAPA